MSQPGEIEIDESSCGRCQQPNPEASTGSIPNDWEITGEGIVCAGCLTGQDWDSIDQQEREISEAAENG